jgi:hypothetical protein
MLSDYGSDLSDDDLDEIALSQPQLYEDFLLSHIYRKRDCRTKLKELRKELDVLLPSVLVFKRNYKCEYVRKSL